MWGMCILPFSFVVGHTDVFFFAVSADFCFHTLKHAHNKHWDGLVLWYFGEFICSSVLFSLYIKE